MLKRFIARTLISVIVIAIGIVFSIALRSEFLLTVTLLGACYALYWILSGLSGE